MIVRVCIEIRIESGLFDACGTACRFGFGGIINFGLKYYFLDSRIILRLIVVEIAVIEMSYRG